MEEQDDLFDDVLNDAGMLDPADDDAADLFGIETPQPSETDPYDIPLPSIQEYDDAPSPDDDPAEDKQPDLIGGVEIVNKLLATKGIEGTMIKYEGEDGEIEEVDFYSLPADEQLAILTSDDSDHNYGLDESEITTVNFLRENGVTFEEAIEYYKKQAIQEHLDSQNIVGIEVDQYSDEDLFAIDLKAKYDNLTEEDIKIELEKQLEHPELFKKKVDKLRTDYKQIEEEQIESARLQEEQDQEQKVIELRGKLISVAEGIEDIGGLDLDNNDKNQVLAYILDKDINGISPFIKSLDSPKQLFELAWYATKGKEAFDIVHDYYKKEIDKVNKSAYAKGKADALKKATPPKQERQSFRRSELPTQGKKENYPNLDDFLSSQLEN